MTLSELHERFALVPPNVVSLALAGFVLQGLVREHGGRYWLTTEGQAWARRHLDAA